MFKQLYVALISKNIPKKLFLLDAFALIYRSYFAFSNNPRINSKGLNTSAAFGFTNTLLEILNKEKPSHIAVVFDTPEATVRHIEYPEYKANREEMPEDLRKCLPFIIQIIEGFNIPIIKYPGFEADDVIGTLAYQAEKLGYTTYMMTPDKDYGQLVNTNTFMYKPARLGNGAEVLGVEEICKKWDIKNVAQLIDILGLMGDKVDNIPGIPGVGEKTAIQLIKDFDNIENLLINTDKLKGKLKEKVEANKEQALQSKKLATIIIDVPYVLNDQELELKSINKEALKNTFTELEFRNLALKVLGEVIETPESTSSLTQSTSKIVDLFNSEETQPTPISSQTEDAEEPTKIYKTILDTKPNYILCDTEQSILNLISILNLENEYCFDTETTGLDTIQAELVGLSFSVKANEAYYIPIKSNKQEALEQLNHFKPIFENTTKTVIGQNIKYDYQMLLNYGIDIKNKMFDTMVAHYLIMPDMRHNMNILAETYLDYQPISIETLIGKKGKDQINMRDVPLDVITNYAAEDADITLQLKTIFDEKLNQTETKKLFETVELPLIKTLSAMEREGINLDVKKLNTFSKELQEDITKVDADIQQLAGTKFNIASPKQVGEILFDYLKIIDKPKKTKTGQYATSEDILSKLENKHPIVSKILDYRELVKLKSTYVDTLPLLINPITQRIHTTYNQVVAVTGRLSSDNPNLQNIPIRTERGRQIRTAFIPRNEDYTLLSADYSQIELRIVASISGDEAMCEAFNLNKDIHIATAAKVFNVAEAEVTKDMRYKAKSVNFGIIYGQGAFGLAENLNIPRVEAKTLIDNYFAQYTAIKKYMDDTINFARETGFVQTLLGRKRWLKDINSNNATVRSFAERNAINAPIQGSAADMIKIAMINIHDELNKLNLKSKLLLQVHDELIFDIYKPELGRIQPIIKKLMQEALPLKVPVEVSVGTGNNWLDAH